MRKKLLGVSVLVLLLSLMIVPLAQAQQITLKFACWDYELNGYDKTLIEEFEKANPDIKVEVYDMPASEYPDKMLIVLAGGEDIDVFYAKDPTMYGGLVLRKQIMPLDELIARDGVDLAGYGGNLENVKIDDTIYGLPYRGDFWILFYNKDLFDSFGVPYPTNDMTWEEFEETAKLLTSGEGASKTYGTYIHTWASTYFMYGLQKHMGDLVEGPYEMLKDGLEMARRIQLVDKSAADYATNRAMGAHYRGLFEQGNIGMLYMGTWYMQALLLDEQEGLHNVNWGIARLPQWEGLPHATIGNVTPVVINARTKHQEAAWRLVKFLSGSEGASILAENVLVPGYLDSSVFDKFAEVDGFPGDNMEALVTETVYMEWPPHSLSGLLGKMVEEEIVLAMTENKSIDDAIRDMELRREEIILLNQ
ncbi:MAG: sugar ABC transporter substrate-binding protein [Bacillota bacterium]|jgi:multiple sugar transport system substrate-binding protein|nr:sugar ABC transporter substrate-binding protein [Bacillota bacterium]HHT91147.1 sugar ABC transporter substrate-binding protein [Bacillota bacterium]